MAWQWNARGAAESQRSLPVPSDTWLAGCPAHLPPTHSPDSCSATRAALYALTSLGLSNPTGKATAWSYCMRAGSRGRQLRAWQGRHIPQHIIVGSSVCRRGFSLHGMRVQQLQELASMRVPAPAPAHAPHLLPLAPDDHEIATGGRRQLQNVRVQHQSIDLLALQARAGKGTCTRMQNGHTHSVLPARQTSSRSRGAQAGRRTDTRAASQAQYLPASTDAIHPQGCLHTLPHSFLNHQPNSPSGLHTWPPHPRHRSRGSPSPPRPSAPGRTDTRGPAQQVASSRWPAAGGTYQVADWRGGRAGRWTKHNLIIGQCGRQGRRWLCMAAPDQRAASHTAAIQCQGDVQPPPPRCLPPSRAGLPRSECCSAAGPQSGWRLQQGRQAVGGGRCRSGEREQAQASARQSDAIVQTTMQRCGGVASHGTRGESRLLPMESDCRMRVNAYIVWAPPLHCWVTHLCLRCRG